MMHQTPPQTSFEAADLYVVTVDGEREPDTLAFYDRRSAASWLSMHDPLDLRDYR